MKKILYINNFEAPYRVPFFNLLGEHYDLTLAFSETNEEQLGRDKKWFVNPERKYKVINLKCKKIFGKKICFDVKKMLGDYDLVFMDLYGSPTNMYAIHCLRKTKTPFVLSVDGMLHRENERTILKKIKKYLLAGPMAILSPSEYVDGCLKEYGVPNEKIYRYHFTSLTEADVKFAKELTMANKSEIRSQLNILEDKVVLSIGQFIYRKGFDVLLNAWKGLDNQAGLYIVGGTPTEEYLNLTKNLELRNVHFEGFKTKSELASYFAAADIFVLPTREDIWGLVINEAMAYGLPIITTDRCVAGLELVKDDVGYIVPVGDSNILRERILDIIENSEKQCLYGNNSLEKISDYTVENMVKPHIELFDNILNKKMG